MYQLLRTFTSKILRSHSGDVSSIVCAVAMPALLTRIDGVPSVSLICSAAELTAAASVTSQAKNLTWASTHYQLRYPDSKWGIAYILGD